MQCHWCGITGAVGGGGGLRFYTITPTPFRNEETVTVCIDVEACDKREAAAAALEAKEER